MAFIPTPNGVKVAMVYTLAGQQMVNVFHVRVPGAVVLADLQAIGGVFLQAWTDRLRAHQAQSCILQMIQIRDASVNNGLGLEYTNTLPLAGQNDPTGLPNNVAIAVKLTSGLVGRSQRGRFYFGGVTNSNLDGQNSPSTVVRAALSAFVSDLIGDLNALGFDLAVASFFTNGVARAAGVLTDIIGSSVNDTLDSQRRRLPERGA